MSIYAGSVVSRVSDQGANEDGAVFRGLCDLIDNCYIYTELNSSDSLKLPGTFVWTEGHIQLRVVSVAVNRGKVHLDNIKQFACINREKQWPEARALRYTEVQIQTLRSGSVL